MTTSARIPFGRWLVVGVSAAVLGGCANLGDKHPGARATSEGFCLGADISALAAPEGGGRKPLTIYQENGVVSDELTILRRHGWSAFRVRVFVSPVREAPDNTLEKTIPLACRIKESGSTLMLCLHLSDTWADPQHQDIPVAWRGLNFEQLERAVEQHAHEVVARLKAAGAMPDWVQVGNEITRGTLWPVAQLGVPGSKEYAPPEPDDEAVQWDRLARLLKAGIRGVKSAAGDTPPRIAMHIDKGASWEATRWFFDHLAAQGVDYDIMAQSFYPEWNHGTLEQLRDNMVRCAERYGRDFLLVETGYGPSHQPGNTSMLWPETPQGRLQFMADAIATVRQSPRGIGVMYWAPEREAWNNDGTPGPVVFVLERAEELRARPASRAPEGINP